MKDGEEFKNVLKKCEELRGENEHKTETKAESATRKRKKAAYLADFLLSEEGMEKTNLTRGVIKRLLILNCTANRPLF